ncbi:ROK family protein [bacterium]|nr:MAG: ROK family protein [bacterium]
MQILGIDIGGSGIKGAIVDTNTGEMLTERFRLETPKPATPVQVAQTVKKLIEHFQWEGQVGCGFPAVIQHGIVRTASNIDKSWIGVNAKELFKEHAGNDFQIVNDADAAGLAEMNFGAGKDQLGVVVTVTVGTGIGSAVFTDGVLLPNSEFGHIIVKDQVGEKYASDATRKREDLKWDKWGKRFNEYLQRLEFLLWPDMIILGGGASKKFDKYETELNTKAIVKPALLQNNAGIIGAACAWRKHHPLGFRPPKV